LRTFLDSSALAKRFLDEVGSARIAVILSSASQLGLSIIATTEVVSAFCRRRREGILAPNQYRAAKDALYAEVGDATIIPLSGQIFTRAVEILERWPLRAADALHVACAAEWRCDLFVSADERQCKAARAYGLRVERLAVG
jgi:hypothetical protein